MPMILPLLAIGLGGGIVVALAAWVGVRAIGEEVRLALWVVAPAAALFVLQLHMSAVAWRLSVGGGRPRVSRYFRVRVIREAVNSLLPVAQLGGNVLGIRLLAQRGVPAATAAAGTTLDITVEVVTQLLFTLMGMAVLGLTGPAGGAPWVGGVFAAMAAVAIAFLLALRLGLLRVIEALARPIGRFFPGVTVDALRGMHAELLRQYRDRGALLAAGALHLGAWLLGVAETWLALWAMGHGDGMALFWAAFVIESLGMAARSAGFAIPGALGVQEGGFVLVCGLYGIPSDAAIALSMVKRARELAVGVPGLIMWQWSEGRRVLAARRD